MSAELLRRAAAKMRDDADVCGDQPQDFIPAVADWLEEAADQFPYCVGTIWISCALVVALTYLGEA